MTGITAASFDTNILIYSVDLRDIRKHNISKRIVQQCALAERPVALQCLNEFYHATTRKRTLSLTLAFDTVQETREAMPVIPPSEQDLLRAMQNHDLHGIPFYDALLCATLGRAGCSVMFTEDLQHRRRLDQIELVDPFRLTESELDAMLA